MVQKSEKIWIDGQFVDWDAANVHVLTHALHYGYGVFEGIRAYKCADGTSAVFRLDDHLTRLFESAYMLQLPMPFDQQTLTEVCLETLRTNKMREGYLRPIAYVGTGGMGLGVMNNPTQVVVITWPWGAYLGEEGLQKGIRCCISSYPRNAINSLLSKGKIIGQYVNSILAKRDALKNGFDEALMLDTRGYVAEGTGENIFLVKNGVLQTPPLSAAILGGITRDSIITLATDLGIDVRETMITREQLYVADEVFLVGTAAEVTPVREIDHRTIGIGARGEMTKRLQEAFFSVVSGQNERYAGWLSRYHL